MKEQPKVLVVFTFIVIAALTRMLPHPPNFAPIAAMALFAGVYMKDRKLAFLLPVVAMLVSDFGLQLMYWTGFRSFEGFHSGMVWVYGALALITVIGYLMKGRVNVGKLTMGGLAGSILFFAITNFGVWATGALYPATMDGLVASYVAAIPFFHYTLLGDAFYIVALFGSFELLKARYPQLALVNA